MKIRKFESFDEFAHYGYTDEIEKEIIEHNSNKKEIIYYVSKIGDKTPQLRQDCATLEDALDRMSELNKIFTNEFCIYETVSSALTRTDIEKHFEIKKYNL